MMNHLKRRRTHQDQMIRRHHQLLGTRDLMLIAVTNQFRTSSLTDLQTSGKQQEQISGNRGKANQAVIQGQSGPLLAMYIGVDQLLAFRSDRLGKQQAAMQTELAQIPWPHSLEAVEECRGIQIANIKD